MNAADFCSVDDVSDASAVRELEEIPIQLFLIPKSMHFHNSCKTIASSASRTAAG